MKRIPFRMVEKPVRWADTCQKTPLQTLSSGCWKEFRASRTSLWLLRRLCVPRRLIRKKRENCPETREPRGTNPGLLCAPHRILEFTNHESSIAPGLAPRPHDIIALDPASGLGLAGRAIVTSRSAHAGVEAAGRLPLASRLPLAPVPAPACTSSCSHGPAAVRCFP